MASMLDSGEDQKVLDWLAEADFSHQHNEHLKKHQEGTGQWLLASAKFRSWVEGTKQMLFCPGHPGAGKTTLAAAVIHHLRGSPMLQSPSVGLAYIYFSFWQREQQIAEDLLANLARQLAQGRPSLPANLRDLYLRHKTKHGHLLTRS